MGENGVPPAPTVERLHWTLGLSYLFFRPAGFFRDYLDAPPAGLVVLAAWVLGIAGTLDRMEQRLLREQFGGKPNPAMDLVDDWSVWLGLALALGAVSGAFYWWIGGWWYRKRVLWSGAAAADPKRVRRVYLFASLVWALPAILYTAWTAAAYPTPRAASAGDDWVGLVVLVFLFGSIYVSYRGVRIAFDLRTGRSRFWFLIGPAALYVVALGGVAAFMMLAPDAPNVSRPATHEAASFRVQYPGNWSVEPPRATEVPERMVTITPLLVDAAVTLFVFGSAVDPDEEVEVTVDEWRIDHDLGPGRPFDRWGPWEGAGVDHEVTIDGAAYRFRVFVATTETDGFEVRELFEVNRGDSLEPGFRLIRESFRLREPDEEGP